MGYRLSIDTGGTFTDVVIMDQMGVQTIGKALTTPQRAFGGSQEALEVAAAEINTTLGAMLVKPACYGRSGVQSTVSNAACVPGYFDQDFFTGGRMRLDKAAAQDAIATVAEQIGRTVVQTAWDIINLASEGMIRAIHESTTAEGLIPQESTIVAGGRGCGTNIMTIARELDCERVILPKVASALSASSMRYADIVKEETTNSARFRGGVSRNPRSSRRRPLPWWFQTGQHGSLKSVTTFSTVSSVQGLAS